MERGGRGNERVGEAHRPGRLRRMERLRVMPGHGQQAQDGAARFARAVFPRDRRHRRHVAQHGKPGLRAAQAETDGADLLRGDWLVRRRPLHGAGPRR